MLLRAVLLNSNVTNVIEKTAVGVQHTGGFKKIVPSVIYQDKGGRKTRLCRGHVPYQGESFIEKNIVKNSKENMPILTFCVYMHTKNK